LETILHFDVQDIAKVAEIFAEDNEYNHLQRFVSFDINQMFTALDQDKLLQYVQDVLLEMSCTTGITSIHVPKPHCRMAYPGPPPDKRSAYAISPAGILAATEFEVKHSVFTAGNVCLKQKRGASIGGMMSPFGARCTCIMQEYRWWLSVHGLLTRRLTVLRLMDDTLIRYELPDEHVLVWFEFLCYSDGLIVERDNEAARFMRGLGCELHIHEGVGTIVTGSNKNEQSLLVQGTMKFPRYPHWLSDMPRTTKTETVIGQVITLVRITSWNGYPAMYRPMWLLLYEFMHRGYSWRLLNRILRRLDICRLPVKRKGSHLFGMIWYDVLKGVSVLAAGQQYTICLHKYDFTPSWGWQGPTGPC
jgi:hypothetical protein